MRTSSRTTLRDLIEVSIIDAPLTLLRSYYGHQLTAIVQTDGRVSYDGKVYKSLSTAGGMARASVVGPPFGEKVAFCPLALRGVVRTGLP